MFCVVGLPVAVTSSVAPNVVALEVARLVFNSETSTASLPVSVSDQPYVPPCSNTGKPAIVKVNDVTPFVPAF